MQEESEVHCRPEQDTWGLPWSKAEELGLLEDPRVENVHM